MTKALIIVDVQNDFVEGGTLGVDGGLAVASRLAELVEKNANDYDAIVTTSDWHVDPGEHFSDTPDFDNSWPRHCVAETEGAEYVKVLQDSLNAATKAGARIFNIRKGEFEAAYSGFEGKTAEGGTLTELLKQEGIEEVDITGIATDYCVRATALDAVGEGFKANVLTDYIVGINETMVEDVLNREFTKEGVTVDGVLREVQEITEEEFLASYNPKNYAPVSYTADLAIFTIRNGELSLLMIKRGGHPFKDCWALPGGFVNADESSEKAAIRELKEETGIDVEGIHLEQLKTYSEPGRDPRMRVVSTAYLALIPNAGIPVAGDDAAEAHFFSVNDLLNPAEGEEIKLAFDHEQIILDGLQRCRDKIEWAPIAPTFLDETGGFTIADLRRVYETVWGVKKMHEANFRRKVLSVNGFLVPLGAKGESQFHGGRSADLYKLGDATMLFPPILRPVDGEEEENEFDE